MNQVHQSINPLAMSTGTLAADTTSPLSKRTDTTTSRTANTWTITLTFATEAEAMAAYQALPQPVQREQQEDTAC